MTHAIIGAGEVGTALARLFVRTNIDVAIANTRGADSLASLVHNLGQGVVPASVEDAYRADVIFLAVPFSSHAEVARRFVRWDGKIVVDVTNAFNVPSADLGGRLSSHVVANAFAGARVVKAFNHLPVVKLGTNPTVKRQVVFVSSDDDAAGDTVADLAVRLGFEPVRLGRLDQGGVPLHAVNGLPGGLLFQNLAKVD